MKNIKNYIIVIVLFICFGLVLWIAFHKEPVQDDSKLIQAKAKIGFLQAQVAYSKTITDSLKKVVPILEEKHKLAIAVKDKRIKTLEIRLASNRETVMKEVEDEPEVKDFILDQDSLATAQSDELNQVKQDWKQERHVLNQIVDQQDSTISKLDQVNAIQETVITNQEKQLKKDKRREKVLKVLIPVALVLGVVIGL